MINLFIFFCFEIIEILGLGEISCFFGFKLLFILYLKFFKVLEIVKELLIF